MAKLLKLRRGTTTQHGSFTGAEGEVTVDTDKETLVVHDGSTAGGHPVAAEDMANVSSASIAGRLANDSIATSKIAAGALPSDVTVASANIVDGTITNGDVNSGAAIAGTKVSPNFGSQNVQTTGNILLGDSSGSSNNRLIFGAGNDIQIFHDPEHSYIQNGTGDLFIKSNADDLVLQAADDVLIRPQNGEDGIKVIGDGAVELYYDNVRKFHTRTDGVNVIGDIDMTDADNYKINLGVSSDLQLYHNGTDSHIDNTTGELALRGATIRLRGNPSNNETLAVFEENGAAKLYYDNSKKIETNSAGVDITGKLLVDSIDMEDSQKILLGTSDDLEIYHDGSHSYISEIGTGDLRITADTGVHIRKHNNENIAKFLANGSVELYYDNSKKIETNSGGADVTGNLNVSNGVDVTGNLTVSGTINSGAHTVTGNIAVSGTVDGRDVASDGTKLDGIESGATADQTASEIVSLINGQSITPNDVTAGYLYGTSKIGRDSNDYIAWSNNSYLDFVVNGSVEFRMEADGDFHADGDVYAFSTTVSSDENLKKDITIVSDAVTKVEALKGVTFKWKKNDADSAGVIAQDVEKVLPEVVKTVNDMEGNEFKAVNYAGLTSILIEAVKDLSARIKVLEAK